MNKSEITDDQLHRFGWAPGLYMIRCFDCHCEKKSFEERGMGAKRCWRCRDCAVNALINESENLDRMREEEINA